MSTKEEFLGSIIAEIFATKDPKIDESRKEQINNFIASTVNGDSTIAYLVVSVKNGVIACILTDKRLIKIDIDPKDVQAVSFKLSTISRINRRILEDRREHFEIHFQSGPSFGLKYPAEDKNITEFFQKVEQHYLENC